MDVLRAALGESRLTYLGKSYGTYLGAWYAQLFPARVRALVLDGAVDPDTPSLQDERHAGGGVPGRARLVRGLVPGHGQLPAARRFSRGGAAAAAVAKVHGLVSQGELRAAGQPPERRAGRGRRHAGERRRRRAVQQVVLARPEDRAGQRVRRGRHGARRTGQPAAGTEPQRDLQQPRRRRHRRSAAWTGRGRARWPRGRRPLGRRPGRLRCSARRSCGAAWPARTGRSRPTRCRRSGPQGASPILVIGTLRDPATPYRWAQALAGDLASGVLLGWNGDGHTAYGEGSACVDTIVNDYLINLSVPRSGTVCRS